MSLIGTVVVRENAPTYEIIGASSVGVGDFLLDVPGSSGGAVEVLAILYPARCEGSPFVRIDWDWDEESGSFWVDGACALTRAV